MKRLFDIIASGLGTEPTIPNTCYLDKTGLERAGVL